MFEKIKNSGKLPLIIGIAVAAIIIIVMAIIIGININKSREANADTKLSDSANQKEIVDSAEETDEPIVIIDEVVEEEETTEEEPEQKEEKEDTKQNTNIKYFIRVNYGQNVVNIYTKDENGEYTVPYKAMLCSTGKATPRSGTYTMPSGTYSRGTWGLMVGNVWAQYFTRIKGSILFHSVPYTERNKWSLEYWEYDKLGTAASAGCVRLTVENAKWIYNNCPSGTKVEFYTDSNPGPFGKPTEQKISEHEEVRGWDPEDPDPNNPWKTYTPKQEDITTLPSDIPITPPSDTGITPPEEIPTTPPADTTTPITPTEPDTSTGNETENPSEGENLDEGDETPGESEEPDDGTEIPDDNNDSDEGNGTTDGSESSDGKIEEPSEDESSEESSDEQVQTSIEG